MDKEFPWGDRNPPEGFKVGDYVGIIHSDENPSFDNPEGQIVTIDEGEFEDDGLMIGVQVVTTIMENDLYLIKRKEQV